MNFNLLPALPALIPVALLFWVILSDKKKRDADSKYPFRKKFYRLPGEYATHRARQLSEKGEEGLYCVITFAALAFALILLSPTNRPITAGILASLFLCSAYFIRSLHKHFDEARKWRLGALGERVVGDYLIREFLPKGFHVFHDIQQDKAFTPNPFNYDHILLDHRGVFLIETKTRSKKLNSNRDLPQHLTVSDERITFPDGRFDDETIPRLKENAIELSEELSNIIESNIPVYPLLVYPGWDVSQKPQNPTAPLCDPRDISKEVEKKPEKALDGKTVDRVIKHFENLARNIDNTNI
ncbi:MAG: nuclease-related domain-containing protein [Roseibacillus sp.]